MKQLKIESFLLAGIIVIAGGANGQTYDVKSIPAALAENVDVVVRSYNETFKIEGRDRAVLSEHKVYTIMNDRGKAFAQEVASYDKLTKVKKFEGILYDASGRLVRKLKSDDIHDQSYVSGYSLYEDNRIKWAELSHSSYPYTVEFDIETNYKFLFYIPSFSPVRTQRVSVQNATYKLTYPLSFEPRYKQLNITGEPAKHKEDGNLESLTWTISDVLPVKQEPMSESFSDRLPQVLAAPSGFKYDDYEGTMESWDGFGKWISSLNDGRDVLPEATKEKIRELTHGLPPEEKVRVLYRYLQSKTRYVSIQLGIGGFQPFEASVVDRTGYGDCKALSNYMVAMLKEAGVKSNYVLIKAGRSEAAMRDDFPSTQFNHAIVMVPNGKDTLWLECTNQTNPFGYMGSFTGERKALAITPDGAKVVRTLRYPTEINRQFRKADVVVGETGDAKAKVTTTYSGLQYENDDLDGILDGTPDQQKKWIYENTGIPSFDVNSYSISADKKKIPAATVKIDLNLRKLATTSGKRMFINPNLMNRSTFVPEKVSERKTDVILKTGYIDADTVVIHFPEGMYPEYLPESIHHESRFGEYTASFKVESGQLTYIRKMKVNKGTFPASSYGELIEFYQNVGRADNSKIVFLTKT